MGLGDSEQFSCGECGASFASREAMQMHSSAKHPSLQSSQGHLTIFSSASVKKWLFAVGGLAAVALLVAFLASAGSQPPAYADDSSSVMYFYSPTCPHCAKMAPILNELATRGYRVKLMDVLKNPGYWQQYDISGTPTWISASGNRISGEQSKAALEAFLAANGAKIK